MKQFLMGKKEKTYILAICDKDNCNKEATKRVIQASPIIPFKYYCKRHLYLYYVKKYGWLIPIIISIIALGYYTTYVMYQAL